MELDFEGIRPPKTKTGLKTFNKIIEVSKSLFAKQGFNQTSINQIIETSKIATGTFYIYFDDKRAIYNFLLKDYSVRIRKRIADAVKDYDTRYDKEYIGLRTYIKFAVEDKLVYRIIWESLFIESELFVNYYTNFSKYYAKSINGSIDAGELDNNIDANSLSFMLMGISTFLGLKAVFKDSKEPGSVTDEVIDKIAKDAMYILKNGMFNDEEKN